MTTFLSYARNDGAALANRLANDLPAVWLDTRCIEGGAVWSTEIERVLDAPDTVVIAILTPGSFASEICRAEQLRALRKGRRLIPILGTQGADRPLYLEARNYRDFSDSSRYPTALNELLADIDGCESATLRPEYRATRVTYVTAPPRVANYLERPEALRALRDTLFAPDGRQPIALTGLAGMGGIGKTVLAKALTEDEVVQQAFPDGIVWITAGRDRQRDFIAEMREVAKALGDDLSRYENALACENQYRTVISNKAALIVLDDVWSRADLEPLLAESPRSRFLFTTRDASIGRFVAAREHTADLLDRAQARELLAAWANWKPLELPPEADEVIAECGYLPLAVSVIGAMLAGAERELWRDTLDLLRRADLSAIEEQLPPGQSSFFRAIEVSVTALPPGLQQRYHELGVLLEDMRAALPVLCAIWGVGEAEARRVARILADRSLVQRDSTDGAIRLHDLQLDYVTAQWADKESLDLIRGAVRLSAHVIERDPGQFASQMVGRLAREDMPARVRAFADQLVRGAPKLFLRPLRPVLHPPGTALLRTLSAHSASVKGVAVTADGRRAVSASDDGTLKVWDLESERALRTLEGHFAWVNGVAVTADGRRAVSASRDQTLKVWDLESGRALRTLEGHSDSVDGVAVTADGRRAVSASRDQTLKVWDLESGRALRTLEGHSSWVTGVAVTPDGRRAVSASYDKTLKVWDLESGRALRTLEGHSDGVHGVATTADGRRAVSASRDQTLKVWDLESSRALRTLEGHSSWVSGVAVTPDGRRAVSGSYDQTLKVWDLESGRALRTLEGHSDGVHGVATTADGRRAVSASYDKTLKVWDLESSRALRTLEGHSDWVHGVATTADGRRAVSASDDQTLKAWDLEWGRAIRTLEGHSAGVHGVAVTADGRRAVSASRDQTLNVWDLESGRALRTLEGHSDWVDGVAVTADGRRAVSASDDKTLKVWDLESGIVLATFTADAAMRCCACTIDNRIVAGDAAGNVHILRLELGDDR